MEKYNEWTPPSFEDLNKKTETLTQRVEWIERNIWLKENTHLLSADIRGMYFKFQAGERWWQINPDVVKEYDKFLDRVAEWIKAWIYSQLDYFKFSAESIKEVNSLRDKNWSIIANQLMDWWFVEWMYAVYTWFEKAGKKVISELEDTLNLIVNKEEWIAILNWLWEALKDPVEFFQNIINFIWAEYQSVSRDIKVLRENTTKNWFAVEMGQFIPETAIPLIVSSVWQWKFVRFLKFMKIDKLLPEGVIKKLEKAGEEWKVKWKEGKWEWHLDKKLTDDIRKVDILDWNFWFNNDKLPLATASKSVERLSYYMDIDYLMWMEWRFDKVLKTLDEMSDYIVKRGDDIMKSSLKDEFDQNFNRLRKRMWEIESWWRLNPIEKEELHNLVETKFKEWYYTFRPQWRPKE